MKTPIAAHPWVNNTVPSGTAGSFGMSRRRFLLSAATAAVLPSLSNGQDASQRRILFFNLSHENYEGTQHHLVVCGRRYLLTKVKSNPAVLARARQTNRFLASVPDSHITHHLEAATVTTDISTLGYIVSNADPASGTWSMSMLVQFVPLTSTPAAFVAAQAHRQPGPLLISAKRLFYNQPAASSLDDLLEEQMLVDSNDHARTLIGLHPDLISADPDAASVIHNNHISTNSKVNFLAGILRGKGPALPQAASGQQNATGWATLVPVLQDDGTPFKNTQGLNQYFADWHPQVDQQVGGALPDITNSVKDDTTLGEDATPYSQQNPAAPVAGKVWFRHDGNSNVVHTSSPSPFQAAVPARIWDFQAQNGEAGLVVRDPKVAVNADGTVTVTLDNIDNWFLRFLSMYLQFVSVSDQLIPVDQLPLDTIQERAGQKSSLDKTNSLFAGIVPNPFAVAGIPVYPPGRVTVTVKIPGDAKVVKVLLGGLSLTDQPPAPEEIDLVGTAMTFAFNYGVVTLFMAAGVSTLGPIAKLVVGLVGQEIVQSLLSALGPSLAGRKFDAGAVTAIMINLLKGILNGLAGRGLAELASAIAGALGSAQVIDSVPAFGQIARAAAAFIGAAQLLETSIEIGISPWWYEFDLVLTHTVSFRINPDPQNNQFPQMPSGYTLYYKVSYLFDNGTSPHTLPAVDVPDTAVSYIPVTIPDIPRGGQVDVLVGFYARKSDTPAGQNDWCAGRGSTGLTSNLQDQLPDVTIKQEKIPISATTKYIHTYKSALDASGRHVWIKTPLAPPYTPPSGLQAPGSLGAFRSITVRQGTSKQKGFVGYAWQAYSSGIVDCTANSPGQLDQAANLNTNTDTAEDGYSRTSCGLQGGALNGIKLAYSLLGDGDSYYLDTSTLRLRKINLDSTGFAPGPAGEAWGRLNLDSTTLLLHPAGHVVSINNSKHKMETLRLPSTAVQDGSSVPSPLARVRSGKGSRPGLMTSPAAAGISPDGHIIVLEDNAGNNRLQAFDLGGNPMPIFSKQNNPYFFSLTATPGVTYLDLAIEYTGYIYVLSQNPTSKQFRLDIYHPTQAGTQPISTTTGVTAARIAVDLWRSLYALNFEALQLPGGITPHITEPSVSIWIPSPPDSGTSR